MRIVAIILNVNRSQNERHIVDFTVSTNTAFTFGMRRARSYIFIDADDLFFLENIVSEIASPTHRGDLYRGMQRKQNRRAEFTSGCASHPMA